MTHPYRAASLVAPQRPSWWLRALAYAVPEMVASERQWYRRGARGRWSRGPLPTIEPMFAWMRFDGCPGIAISKMHAGAVPIPAGVCWREVTTVDGVVMRDVGECFCEVWP